MGFNRVRLMVPAVVLSVVSMLGVGGASASALTVGHVTSGVSYASYAKHVQYSHVRVNGLRFRTRASSRGTVRGLLYRGDRVQIIGSAVGPWIHVRLTARSRGGSHKGARGWVAKRYLYGPRCKNYRTWPCSAWR